MSPEIVTPAEVARYLHTTEANLAQLRYRGTGPAFTRCGRRILYRWADITAYLDANLSRQTGGVA